MHGTVTIASMHSEALGVDKRVVVYLPAGYEREPDRRWPVFYYLQGNTSEETEWITYGLIDRAADALGLDAIIVTPDGDDSYFIDSPMAVDYGACLHDGTGLYDSRHEDPQQTCVRAPRYETYIVRDVVDWVDATYRTIGRREGRGIAGLSMGGYGALMLAMRHPDRFAAAASHSGVDALLYRGPHPYSSAVELYDDPATYGSDKNRDDTFARQVFGTDIAFWRERDPAVLAQQLVPGQLAIYIDCGTEDSLVAGARYLDAILTSRHVEHAFSTGPGKHDYDFWRPRVRDSLAFLRDHLARR